MRPTAFNETSVTLGSVMLTVHALSPGFRPQTICTVIGRSARSRSCSCRSASLGTRLPMVPSLGGVTVTDEEGNFSPDYHWPSEWRELQAGGKIVDPVQSRPFASLPPRPARPFAGLLSLCAASDYTVEVCGGCLGEWMPDGTKVVADPAAELRPLDLCSIKISDGQGPWARFVLHRVVGAIGGAWKMTENDRAALALVARFARRAAHPTRRLRPETWPGGRASGARVRNLPPVGGSLFRSGPELLAPAVKHIGGDT